MESSQIFDCHHEHDGDEHDGDERDGDDGYDDDEGVWCLYLVSTCITPSETFW